MRINDTGITGVRRLAAWPDAREDSVHFSSASNRLQQGVPMLWGRASRSPQASRVQAARHLEPADKETLFLNSSPLASRAQIALRAVAGGSHPRILSTQRRFRSPVLLCNGCSSSSRQTASQVACRRGETKRHSCARCDIHQQ